MRIRPNARIAPMATSVEGQDAVVHLVGVSRDYGHGIVALHDVDLRLTDGQSCAIVGPSGSGKSTLLNIIGLLDRPSSGEYFLNGYDVANADEKERVALRRDFFGFVFQDFHLLNHRSVVENIMLGGFYSGGTRRTRASKATDAAELVGLSHRLSAAANTLSGGERQRVAIARALMNDPSLLLCDEPTGNLDSQTSQHILDLLLGLGLSITVVIITHDSAVASRCGRVVTVLDGKVLAA